MDERFRRALQVHEVDWAEDWLAFYGITRPGDLVYLKNPFDNDVVTSLWYEFGFNYIDARRIEAAANDVGSVASSSSSSNNFQSEASLPMHVDTSLFELDDAFDGVMAVSALDNDLGDTIMALQTLALEAKNWALINVRACQALAREGKIADSIAESLSNLEPRTTALLVGRALNALQRGMAECKHLAEWKQLKALFVVAEKSVYDHLIYQVQLQIPLNQDRDLCIQLLGEALEVGPHGLEQKSVPRDQRDPKMTQRFARLMLAYRKVITKQILSLGFLSNAACTALKRGARPKRKAKCLGSVPENETATIPTNGDQCFDASETPVTPTNGEQCPESPEWTPSPCPAYSETTSDAGSSVCREPPGLEGISRLAVDFSRGVEVEERRNAYKAAAALKPPRMFGSVVHASGARTSNNTPDARSDTFECVAVPDDCEALKSDSGVIVVSELNRTLVWRDYNGQYRKSHPAGALEPLKMSNGHDLYIRPGAEALVASLLRNSKCQLVIAAGMCFWQCLPIARTLLEKAIPGSWVVDEVFEGRWESNKWENYVITDAEVTAERTPNDDDLASGASWELKFHDDRSASCIRGGEKCYCKLTPDGHLQWFSDQGTVVDTWTRASRSKPLSFVRRDKSAADSHQDRVFIFDRDFYIEETKDNEGEVKHQKELQKVWSELLEVKLGSFNETNTIVIDASSDVVSHPQNVLRVPAWYTSDTDEMSVLEQYIGEFLTQQPQNFLDHIQKTPIVFNDSR